MTQSWVTCPFFHRPCIPIFLEAHVLDFALYIFFFFLCELAITEIDKITRKILLVEIWNARYALNSFVSLFFFLFSQSLYTPFPFEDEAIILRRITRASSLARSSLRYFERMPGSLTTSAQATRRVYINCLSDSTKRELVDTIYGTNKTGIRSTRHGW